MLVAPRQCDTWTARRWGGQSATVARDRLIGVEQCSRDRLIKELRFTGGRRIPFGTGMKNGV